MQRREEILAFLQAQGVEYELVEHPAAYDMEDIARFGVSAHGHVAKNLFLRDSRKGRRHVLVTVRGDKQVDLQKLGAAIGERLSFASENRLRQYLNLQKGEVTPLGVFYDQENAVEVYLDQDLEACGRIGVHPADNTATVFLRFADLLKLVQACGNKVALIEL